MHMRLATATAALAAALAWLLMATGCSHMPHWAWHHPPPPPPAPVHELDISGAPAGDSFTQYWKRNTLLIDLSAARGTGSIVLTPAAGAAWPVRLALRVTPGAFAVLQVNGATRVTLPINPAGTAPVDLELTPDIYTAATPKMTVSWGPQAAGS